MSNRSIQLFARAVRKVRAALLHFVLLAAGVAALGGVIVTGPLAVDGAADAAGLKVEPLFIQSGTRPNIKAGKAPVKLFEHRFEVELALTDEEQRLGLMYRTRLGADRGMLFIYRPAQEITMWMRNTRLSLDMIFIRSDGVIHRIAENAEPYSLETIASQGNVVAVLEVLAGTAKRLGLRPGDKVRSKALGTNGGS